VALIKFKIFELARACFVHFSTYIVRWEFYYCACVCRHRRCFSRPLTHFSRNGNQSLMALFFFIGVLAYQRLL